MPAPRRPGSIAFWPVPVLPGCFACGDVVGLPYQYIKAAGEGNVAALSAATYLDMKKREE